MVQTPLRNFINPNSTNNNEDDISSDIATFIAVEDEINRLLQEQPVNLESLRRLAKERNGYQNKSMRIRVWPKLFNINRYNLEDYKRYIYYFENFNSDYVEEVSDDEEQENKNQNISDEKKKLEEIESEKVIEKKLNQVINRKKLNNNNKSKNDINTDTNSNTNTDTKLSNTITDNSKNHNKNSKDKDEKNKELDKEKELIREKSIKKLNPDLPVLTTEEEKRIKENYLQIDCDVRRSLWGGPPTSLWTTSYREARRSELSGIIKALLGKFEGLYYYQGLHSLVSVILLTVQNPQLTFAIMCRLVTHTHLLTDFICQKDFDLLAHYRLPLIVEIIKLIDPILYHHLVIKSGCKDFFFSTSWVITWFAHDVSDIDDVTWLFDVIMTSPPFTIYYVAAAYIISIRSQLLEAESDFAQIHAVFSGSVRRWGIPLYEIIKLSDKIKEEVGLARLLCNIPPQLLSKIHSRDSLPLLKPIAFQSFADSDRELLENKRLEVAHKLPLNGFFYRLFFFGLNPPTLSDTPLLFTHANYETVVKIRARVDFLKDKNSSKSSKSPKYPTYKLKYLTQVFSWKPKVLFYFLIYQIRILTLPIITKFNKKYSSTVHPYDESTSSSKKKKSSKRFKTSMILSVVVALGSILTYSYYLKCKNKVSL